MKGQLDLRQFDIKRPSSGKISPKGEQFGFSAHLDEVTLNQRKRDALSGIEKLPTLPNVVHEVIRLTNDPKSRVEDFVSLFSNEQTLAARMLRIANSPFYGMNGKIKTIPKAIVILGYKTLKSLVLASSSTVLFKRGSKEYGFAENGLWLHSVAVARLARHIAKKWTGFSADVADELFVVGLMHDIGKVILCQELIKYRTQFNEYLQSHEPSSVTEMERALLGTDHCEIGEMIIRKWKIGDDIADAISSHHDYSLSDSENCRYNATLVLADLLCNEAGVGLTENCYWVKPIPQSILDITQFDESTLDLLRDEAKGIFIESLEMIDTLG